MPFIFEGWAKDRSNIECSLAGTDRLRGLCLLSRSLVCDLLLQHLPFVVAFLMSGSTRKKQEAYAG